MKIKKRNTEKLTFLRELKESIREVNLAKKGKLKLKTLDEFLEELSLSK